MREFLSSCFMGTFPYYSLVALAVIAYRIRAGLWKGKETLLLVMFLFFYLGLIVQILTFDHPEDVSRRYLIPFAPLLFGFTAWGVVRFYDRLKRPLLFSVLAFFPIALLVWDITIPVSKEYCSAWRVAENASIESVSDFIKADYKGEKNRDALPVWWYEPRFSSRPILKGAPPQLTCKVGGANWSEYFPDDPVDYLILSAEDVDVPDGFELVFETDVHRVFKPAEAGENDPAAPAETGHELTDDVPAEDSPITGGFGA